MSKLDDMRLFYPNMEYDRNFFSVEGVCQDYKDV